MSRFLRRSVLFVSVIVLICVAFIVIWSVVYDPDTLKIVILQQLEKHSGRHIDMSHVQFRMFPSIGVAFTDVAIRERDTAQVLMTARRLEVELEPWALLQRQVVLQRLILDQPQARLSRDSTGHWNVASPPSTPPSRERPPAHPFALFLLVHNVSLRDGIVTLADESHPEIPQSLTVTALNAEIASLGHGFDADVQITASVPLEGKVATMTLSGRVTDTTMPGQRSTSGLGIRFNGTGEVQEVDIGGLVRVLTSSPQGHELQGTAHLRTDITLAPTGENYDLLLSAMRLSIDSLVVTGQLTLSRLLTDASAISATISASSLRIEDVVTRLPVEWVGAGVAALMAKAEIAGTVEVRTMTVSRSLNGSPDFRIAGDVRLTQGRALVGSNRVPVRNVSANLEVEGDQARVTNMQGDYGPLHITTGRVMVHHWPTAAQWDAQATGEGQAAELISLAHQAGQGHLATLLDSLQGLTGHLQATAHAGGSFATGSEVTLREGEVTITDLGFTASWLPAPLRNLSGRATWIANAIQLDQVHGQVGPALFTIDGQILRGTSFKFHELRVRIQGQARDALEMPTSLRPLAAYITKGRIDLSLVMSGLLQSPYLVGRLDANELTVRGPNGRSTDTGSVAVDFAGTLTQASVQVDQFDLETPSGRVRSRGRLGWSPAWDIHGSVEATDLSLHHVTEFLSLGPLQDGTLHGSVQIRGRGSDWTQWDMVGNVALVEGKLAPMGQAEAGRMSVRAQFLGKDLQLQTLSVKLPDSDMTVSGTIRNWLHHPIAILAADSSQFDLRRLIPEGEPQEGVRRPSPMPEPLSSLLQESHVAATLFVKHLYYRRLLITDVTCRISLNNGLVQIDRLMGDTDDGHLAGRLSVPATAQTPSTMGLSLDVNGIPVQHVMASLAGQEQLLTGWSSLKGTVEKDLRTKNVREGWTSRGDIRLGIHDGRVFQLAIVSQVLKILNLPEILQGEVDLARDGMPFHRVTSTVSLNDGIMTIKRLLLDGPVLKISGAGSYNMVSDQLDIILATSPLGSYARLLKQIPLFGKLFAGERQGLDTALFKVSGPATSPQVSYLPIESFATGLTGVAHLAFDILKNAVFLPNGHVRTERRGTESGGIRFAMTLLPKQVLRPENKEAARQLT